LTVDEEDVPFLVHLARRWSSLVDSMDMTKEILADYSHLIGVILNFMGKVNVNVKDVSYRNMLHYLVPHEELNGIVITLVDANADFLAMDSDSDTPVAVALKHHNYILVNHLISKYGLTEDTVIHDRKTLSQVAHAQSMNV
jgi:hypothetical protein